MSSTGGRGRSSGTYRGGGGRGRSYRGGRGRGRGRGRGLGGGPYGGRGEHSAGENGDATPQAGFDPNVPKSGGDNGGSHDELVDLLRRLDGKSYPAYHDIESSTRGWANDDDGYTLYVARAQSDPFAKPTRCRVIVKGDTAKFPTVSYQNRIRTVALSDFLNRMFYDCCRTMGADVGYAKGGGWGGPKGGDIDVSGECDLVSCARACNGMASRPSYALQLAKLDLHSWNVSFRSQNKLTKRKHNATFAADRKADAARRRAVGRPGPAERRRLCTVYCQPPRPGAVDPGPQGRGDLWQDPAGARAEGAGLHLPRCAGRDAPRPERGGSGVGAQLPRDAGSRGFRA